MKTVAIIQARMGSQRLPGKVLQDIAGKPMIDRVVERVKRCESIDGVIVATSDADTDNVLADHCRSIGVKVVRGSENDVLSRYALAASKYHCETVVRITSDMKSQKTPACNTLVTFSHSDCFRVASMLRR